MRGLLFFLSECLKRNLSGELVEQDMTKIGLDAPKAARIGNMWKQTFSSLASTVKSKVLKVNQLVDVQWKFGVTAASDSLRTVNTCFLQLKFVIQKGNKTEDVLMEMTLPQFYKFLQNMEAAQRQCASYSG